MKVPKPGCKVRKGEECVRLGGDMGTAQLFESPGADFVTVQPQELAAANRIRNKHKIRLEAKCE